MGEYEKLPGRIVHSRAILNPPQSPASTRAMLALKINAKIVTNTMFLSSGYGQCVWRISNILRKQSTR